MIHTPAARASTLWHGLGTAAKSVIIGVTAAVLVGAGYAAGTMQTQPLQMSITIYDPTTKQEQDINMCTAMPLLSSTLPELMPDDVRARYVEAVEAARCP